MIKVLEIVMMVTKHCECICHLTKHLKVVKTVNFVIYFSTHTDTHTKMGETIDVLIYY